MHDRGTAVGGGELLAYGAPEADPPPAGVQVAHPARARCRRYTGFSAGWPVAEAPGASCEARPSFGRFEPARPTSAVQGAPKLRPGRQCCR